jgi:hypothetical protein
MVIFKQITDIKVLLSYKSCKDNKIKKSNLPSLNNERPFCNGLSWCQYERLSVTRILSQVWINRKLFTWNSKEQALVT